MSVAKKRVNNRLRQATYRKRHPEAARDRFLVLADKLDGRYGGLLQDFCGLCAYCGEKLGLDWQLDHFVPASKGGSRDIANLVPVCPDCNRSKGAKTFIVWLATRPRNNAERYLRKFA
jgi:5-methylcytosine-specific restriction endonuclease McrA